MAETGSLKAEVEAPATIAVEKTALAADSGSSDVPASKADTEAAAESGPAAIAASADDATKPAASPAASPSASPAGKSKKDRKKANKAAGAAATAAGNAEGGDAAAASASKDGDTPAAATSNGDAEAAAAPGKSSDAAAAAAPSSAADTPGDAAAGKTDTPAAPATTSPAAAAAKKPASSAGGASKPRAAPAAAAAASERVSSTGSGALEDLPDAPKVRALREQLSQNGTVSLTGGVAQPTAPEPKQEGPPPRRLSEHDRVNNTNALELLQSGSFKLVPGKDSVPYEQLKGLRLEDGIDVTRKEEYLTADEFSTVFKMTQEAFKQLPQWKKLQLKKNNMLF